MSEVSEDVAKQLQELEEEQRAISLRRRRLHERLAFYPGYATEQLHRQERELSAKRRDLHERIEAQRGWMERPL